ncbi:helix-turn-helix domain-containing protein [Streptococcus minor]|uniref:helix-turn-helix domain-containing protein n=1 Tax=Streptococcus minor TaxID=229549 RepID=UPI000370BCC2|nr:helix-turn-helix transcriptional regulator [Streptococcus minor]
MATEFGKYLRKLRIDEGEVLKRMAEKLGVSSAFLSAVENGKKKIPKDWDEKLSNLYQFTEEQRSQLKQAQQLSQNLIEIDLEPLNQLQKDAAFAFARSIERFDTQDLGRIAALLNKTTEDLNDNKL